MREIGAQACWPLCARQPGLLPATPESGLRGTTGAPDRCRGGWGGGYLLGPSLQHSLPGRGVFRS